MGPCVLPWLFLKVSMSVTAYQPYVACRLFAFPPIFYKIATKYSSIFLGRIIRYRLNATFLLQQSHISLCCFFATTFAHLYFGRQCHFDVPHQINTVILLRQTLKSTIDYLWRHAILIK